MCWKITVDRLNKTSSVNVMLRVISKSTGCPALEGWRCPSCKRKANMFSKLFTRTSRYEGRSCFVKTAFDKERSWLIKGWFMITLKSAHVVRYSKLELTTFGIFLLWLKIHESFRHIMSWGINSSWDVSVRHKAPQGTVTCVHSSANKTKENYFVLKTTILPQTKGSFTD